MKKLMEGPDLMPIMRGGAYWGYQPEQIEKKQAFASAEGAIAGQIK